MPLQDANPTPSFGGFGLRGRGGSQLNSVSIPVGGARLLKGVFLPALVAGIALTVAIVGAFPGKRQQQHRLGKPLR